jgi:leader peptidase (prepilin peptidase) / N-methyltransferase
LSNLKKKVMYNINALIPFFLIWGSFLNMLGYRLISQESLFIARSFCPHCKSVIAWYDNIPLISFFLLKGKCRHCSLKISWLYPLIELCTSVIFCALLVYISPEHWFSYACFFSALLITIRTDLETMLISRFATLFLIPLGFLLSYGEMLPISLLESICGAITAYAWLFLIGYLFYKITGKIGLGQGDYELMAFIGSFLGMLGWWLTLLVGSLFGSIVGLTYLAISGKRTGTKIPFGPFLAFGAIIFVFFKEILMQFFFTGLSF